MGEALFDLEQVLLSQQEKLTAQEAIMIQTCKSKAVREFTFGTLVGGSVGWAATSKLSKFAQAPLTGGAAILYGFLRFGRSLNSCLDHILSLDGSRMQRELANIIVKKYRDDPRAMQYMHKHFYIEKVFDDSSSDKPMLRWRYRNFFSDNVAYGRRTYDVDSQSDSQRESIGKKADVESKQVLMNHGADWMEDPIDSIFGYKASVEEIHHPNGSNTTAKVLNRSQRKPHRSKRRADRREVSSD